MAQTPNLVPLSYRPRGAMNIRSGPLTSSTATKQSLTYTGTVPSGGTFKLTIPAIGAVPKLGPFTINYNANSTIGTGAANIQDLFSTVQTVALTAATAGTFTLTIPAFGAYGAITTGNINFDASSTAGAGAANLQGVLNTALAANGAVVTVTPAATLLTAAGPVYNTLSIHFGGTYAGLNVPVMTFNAAGLTGGTVVTAVTHAGVGQSITVTPTNTALSTGAISFTFGGNYLGLQVPPLVLDTTGLTGGDTTTALNVLQVPSSFLTASATSLPTDEYVGYSDNSSVYTYQMLPGDQYSPGQIIVVKLQTTHTNDLIVACAPGDLMTAWGGAPASSALLPAAATQRITADYGYIRFECSGQTGAGAFSPSPFSNLALDNIVPSVTKTHADSTYQMATTDRYVAADVSASGGGVITSKLPDVDDAGMVLGAVVTLADSTKACNTHNITLAVEDSADSLDGTANGTYVMSVNGAVVEVICTDQTTGAGKWFIINS